MNPPLRFLVSLGGVLLALVGVAPSAPAEVVVAERSWSVGPPPADVPSERIRVPVNEAGWQIRHTNAGPLDVRLWTVTNPPITSLVYAVRGQIAYEQVEGEGYLELWNVFAPVREGLPEGRYFSRTLAESGELGKVRGTSGWRAFTLPFDRTGTSNAPTRLEINLHLAGPGVVRLGPLQLVGFPGSTGPGSAVASAGWWAPRTTGILGGIAGALFGTLGGVLGTLTRLGRARAFVLTTIRVSIGLGVALLLAGVFAITQRQPFHVWTTLLATGALLAGIFATNLRQTRRQFAAAELRRMTALDAAGGV